MLAYGVFARPKPSRGFLVQDGYGRVTGQFALAERPSREQRNIHHVKVVRRDCIHRKQRRSLSGSDGKVLNIDRALRDSSSEWERIDQRRPLYAGGSTKFVQQAAIESQTPLGVAAKRLIGRDPRGHNLLRTEPGVHMRERPEAADE